MRFIGIDPSLTSAGVAVYDTETKERMVSSFSSGNTGDEILNRHDRLTKLSADIYNFSTDNTSGEVMVAIEGPAYSSNMGKAWDRAGLWWYVVRTFIEHGHSVLEVPPTIRCKYATGLGNSKKDTVMIAAVKTYADFDIKNNDEADATVMMALLARFYGHPIEESLPKSRTDALLKIKK